MRSVALALAASACVLACASRLATVGQEARKGLEPAEFARLVQEISEDGGFFRSDNFTSNETSYLHVIGKLGELGVAGGAYIGVGPEQNFTYIAKVRPRIAFIVDIRRQAIVQHLLYKAVFQLSENRSQFLSNLLSRPLLPDAPFAARATIDGLIEYFGSARAPAEVLKANLAKVRALIEQEFRVPLSARDHERLEYVYSAFQREGLEISYQSGELRGGFRRFPTLGELLLARDARGALGNFLASEDDYQFVRALHRQNRIIPVVGDFAGGKALAAVARYLDDAGLGVSAFYTSNVEQFLFQNGVFASFVENVRRLPKAPVSVLIRAVPMRGEPHPALVPGHRMTTLLQEIPVFLKDFDEGAYSDYRALVTTNFIAGSP
jgi:hypothetical protein